MYLYILTLPFPLYSTNLTRNLPPLQSLKKKKCDAYLKE